MSKHQHNTTEEYILDVLKEKEDEVFERLCEKMPEELKYDFDLYIALITTSAKIKNTI